MKKTSRKMVSVQIVKPVRKRGFLSLALLLFVASMNSALMAVGAQNLQQDMITVSGTVIEAGGETIPGVNVALKNSTQGTITDMNGKYVLTDVPVDGILVFSSVGMITLE